MIELGMLAVAVGLFVGVPIAMWRSALAQSRGRWLPRVVGTEHVAAGSYRDVDVPRFGAAGPPREVHFAAMGAWILGTMFVPGLLGGLFGLLAMGIGAVSIPGLILAWRLFFLGAPLLRGDAGSAERARSAAHYTRVLNAVVLAICAITAVIALAASVVGSSSDPGGWLLGSAAVAFYACVSLFHARLLDRAAAHVDANIRLRSAEPTGVRVDAMAPAHASSTSAHEPADEVPVAARVLRSHPPP